ncbi:MAG: aminodeoxychorismate synthase component [Pseudomonadota bacterium]|jgi:para-aminobenzoate synthetase/4-amino-4-deoxychorismate lyase
MLDLDPLSPVALVDFPGEDGQRRRHTFRRPRQWLVAHDPMQVPALLDAAHAHALAGRWCVGWLAYEAAPGLNPTLPVKATSPGAVHAVWAVFDEAEAGWPSAQGEARASGPAPGWHMGPWSAPWSDAQARSRIHAIHDLIRAGEVYQINLTESLSAPWAAGDATQPTPALLSCFEALHRSQPDGFALYLDGRHATRQPGVVMSVSPELFVDWQGDTLTTRPMKGTAPRRWDHADDQAQAEHLRRSDKERAENLMIVDLLRNDLSRVAATGSVKVPSLFDVQALPTVWQMTSTVTAQARPGLKLSELMAALFPCGSVTGAPKRQAMHHIARLESAPRGVYCGAAGVMAPGGRVTLNVPIRTVSVHTPPPAAPWRAHCGIGSGITLDAQADGEIAEWRHKRAFLLRAEAPFQLLESLRLEAGQLLRLDAHLARLRRAALYFGYTREADWPVLDARVRQALSTALAAHQRLNAQAAEAAGVAKVRLLVPAQGKPTVEVQPLNASPAAIAVHWAGQPMPEPDAFIRHKTTHRRAYEAHKPPAGCFDTLLHNARGELTEFTIGNLALDVDGHWLTPALSSGLLPGVMRGELLASGQLTEAVLTLDHLRRAKGAALINSVRGWLPVDLAHLQAQLPHPST